MKGVLWTEQHNQGKISTYTDPGKELQPQGFRKLSTGFFKSIKKKKKVDFRHLIFNSEYEEKMKFIFKSLKKERKESRIYYLSKLSLIHKGK